MSRIEFPKKPRKDSASALWQTEDGSQVFIGRDYALQNEIDETLAKTRARSCFRGCNTCGACANSQRDATYPKSFDMNAGLRGKNIDCRACEKFRFHDCHNGVMRNSHQDPEPFTQDQVDLIKMAENQKPLI